MEVGKLIIYDNKGKVLFQGGEGKGDLIPYDKNMKVDWLEIKYNSIDYSRYRIVSINVETREPILEEIKVELTEEEKRIQELENQLLIAENEKVGGLL
ncbi:hypothetical protein LSF02_04360 [Clostridioides difficile]|uniref:hypothetical protein n=1 Tax=Clostridioides difficile TaxID=1496 RepID=UPI0010342839|nr:hypothetical protein [Clostridioides difficile]ELX4549593.1 hypothetical protein [Clostridioides difficile]MBY2760526.1 hypothetical protein [Clostridioides difficile]MCD8634759.1 hypothetical protein [Clostridioides difficile]MCE4865432.1 hypothetical protein [Clostridioides difficile]MDN9365592.1 hypothetical protein [Clostridioides difficile]